jgi:hypothetical protein
MSLERGRLEKLIHEGDADGISDWVDEVVTLAKQNVLEEHFSEVARICGPPPETLLERITQAINATSSENGSNTPDFILAEYLVGCLEVFNKTVNRRAEWYGRKDHPASGGDGYSFVPQMIVLVPEQSAAEQVKEAVEKTKALPNAFCIECGGHSASNVHFSNGPGSHPFREDTRPFRVEPIK